MTEPDKAVGRAIVFVTGNPVSNAERSLAREPYNVREAVEIGVNNNTGIIRHDNIIPSVLSILRRQDNE